MKLPPPPAVKVTPSRPAKEKKSQKSIAAVEPLGRPSRTKKTTAKLRQESPMPPEKVKKLPKASAGVEKKKPAKNDAKKLKMAVNMANSSENAGIVEIVKSKCKDIKKKAAAKK